MKPLIQMALDSLSFDDRNRMDYDIPILEPIKNKKPEFRQIGYKNKKQKW